MTAKNWIACMAVGLAMTAGATHADEVKLQHRGLTLNADLTLAEDKQPPDGVIVMTHAGLAHRDMESMAYLRELLQAQGYNTLAINLGLEVDDRHGMYDCKATHRHRYTDAADEIGAWVAWLERQGVKKLVLFGHSRGGAETALYAAEHDHPSVEAVVLLAPDTRETNDAVVYEKRYGKALAPIMARAQKLMQERKPDAVLEHVDFLYCADTSATAETFVSYYGPDPRLDTAYLIPKIRKPALIVLAGDDEVVVNNAKYASVADGSRVQLAVVDGAGHFFRDLYADDAIAVVDDFLKRAR